MSRLILGVLSAFFASSIALADYTAVVYEQNSGKQKELFKLKVTAKTVDGKDHINAVYTDTNGAVAIEQNTILEGSKVLRDEVQQKQTNEVGLIEVKEGTIFFSKTSDGKTKVKEEKLKDTFVVSSSFQRHVKDKWADIVAGKTVAFRYGVWDRQETVGFEITKVGGDVGAREVVVLKMKPSSFIIAAIVDPIFFTFKADGSALLEMNGRTAPKRKDGKKWKDLDAEIVYTY